MDTTSPIKFEEFKKEERFKRLERHLKLAFVKQMERVKAGEDKGYNSNSSPTWPSLSTINPDGMDTSCTNGPSLHVSRVESEVVSHSTNFRKKLPGHKTNQIERKPMATSSVKKFPLNEIDNDRAIMPPPPVNTIFSNRKVIQNASKQSVEDQQNKKRETHSETCSSLKKTSLNSSMTCDENNINFNMSDSANSKGCRVFSRWRVLINDHGKLIIKGTLECGKIARSKPVIQRFTNTKVQSIYKHIYILDGTLVDERDELPEYVRGKFHNGFPDDWENVHQLWRNYLAAESKASFRWPTPITDSDDDLNSEITDFTYCRSKNSQSIEHALTVSNSNAGSSGYHSRTQSEGNQNLEKSKDEVKQVPNIQINNKKVNDSGHSSESKEISGGNIECSVESSKESQNLIGFNSSNSNLKNTSYLYEIIREDKVRTILSNLGDRNCPPQYLDKFIELIDCLRYILSYTPNNNEADNLIQISSPFKRVTEGCQKCNSSLSILEVQENVSNQPNKADNKNEDEKSQNPKKPKNCTENYKQTENHISLNAAHSDEDIGSDSSDSDAYMGIPHVSLSHLIRNKPKRNQRFRDRKSRKDSRNTDKQNEQMQPVENQNVEEKYDSSISITEDEYERKLKERLDKRLEEPFFGVSQNKTNKNLNSEFTKSANISNDIESQQANLKSMELKVSTPSKSKPIVKSNEQVHLDVKLKHPSKTKNFPDHSDVSILDENSFKNQVKANPNAVASNSRTEDHREEEKINENALEHPFLTYDSEDFIDEEEAEKNYARLTSSNHKSKEENKSFEVKEKRKAENTGSKKYEKRSRVEIEHTPIIEKRKGTVKEKTPANEPFGSKGNPKLLTSWIPCVVYNDELKKNCNLTFEGKLLNEAGHVLHRKYVTDPIRERHSAKLIETVNKEYFKLVGDLNDTKHVVPKELLRQCRMGCPTRIKEFCEEWKSLRTVLEKEGANKITNLHNASIDLFAVPTSSRGRKILPPLNYWDGERVSSKHKDVIYTPGHTSEASQMGQSALKKTMTLSEHRSQNNSKMEINSRVSKSSSKPSSNADDLANLEPKPRQLKKRIAQKLQYSSSESEANEPSNKKNFRKPLDPKRVSRTEVNPTTQPGESEILTESAYNVKLRKRQKTDKRNSQKNADPNDKKSRIPAKKSSEPLVTWTYDKGQYQDNMLSDDQSSVYIK